MYVDHSEEQRLAAAARKGDREAFGVLYCATVDHVYRVTSPVEQPRLNWPKI